MVVVHTIVLNVKEVFNMYLKGIYKRNIFQSNDGYVIGLLKVKDNDINLTSSLI